MAESVPTYTDLCRPEGRWPFARRVLGEIHIDSGHLAAIDPVTRSKVVPRERVPKGKFPVLVIEEVSDKATKDVHALVIEFSTESIASWRPPPLESTESELGVVKGVPVDSARAALMDDEYTWRLSNQDVATRMQEGVVHLKGCELAIARSGAGDGVYALWFGYAEGGAIVAALLDFALLEIDKPALSPRSELDRLRDEIRAELASEDTRTVKRAFHKLESLGEQRVELADAVMAVVDACASDDDRMATLSVTVQMALETMVALDPKLEERLLEEAERSELLAQAYLRISPTAKVLRRASERFVTHMLEAPNAKTLDLLSRFVRFSLGTQPWIRIHERVAATGDADLVASTHDAIISVCMRDRVSFDEAYAALLRPIAEQGTDAQLLQLYGTLLIKQAPGLARALGLEERMLPALLATLDDDTKKVSHAQIKALLGSRHDLLNDIVRRVSDRAERHGSERIDPASLPLHNYLATFLRPDRQLSMERARLVADAIAATHVSADAMAKVLRLMPDEVVQMLTE